MRIDVVTIFPDLVSAFASASIVGRAVERGLVDVRVHDLRSAATDPHQSVDDAPFGGGPGMVLLADPIFRTVEAMACPRPVVVLGPRGRRFDQGVAAELASLEALTLICGRYEGIDERVHQHLADEELSVGDYVLAGGEVAAMVVIEATTRLLAGVLGNRASPAEESFADGLLEYPQYTRPADYRGWTVPPVLLSGDHERVARWRRAQALAMTIARRPDLVMGRGGVSSAEADLLREFGLERPPRWALRDEAAPPEP